jgi:hypothetical protein
MPIAPKLISAAPRAAAFSCRVHGGSRRLRSGGCPGGDPLINLALEMANSAATGRIERKAPREKPFGLKIAQLAIAKAGFCLSFVWTQDSHV